MVQNHTLDALAERLSRDVQIFDNLLKLIPAKFYVMEKNDDAAGKFQHNKRKKAPKQAIKDRTKKAKKAKLDPTNIKSIGELQEEKAKELLEQQENESESEQEDEEENSDEEEQIEKMDVESGAFSGLEDTTPIVTEATSVVEEGI